MADKTAREIATKAREIYEQELKTLISELYDKVSAAQKQVEALQREVRGSDWQYGWLADASWNFGPESLDESGVYIEYTIGQEYPGEEWLSYDFLDDPARELAPVRESVVAERDNREAAFRARRREQLERELAELNSKEK